MLGLFQNICCQHQKPQSVRCCLRRLIHCQVTCGGQHNEIGMDSTDVVRRAWEVCIDPRSQPDVLILISNKLLDWYYGGRAWIILYTYPCGKPVIYPNANAASISVGSDDYVFTPKNIPTLLTTPATPTPWRLSPNCLFRAKLRVLQFLIVTSCWTKNFLKQIDNISSSLLIRVICFWLIKERSEQIC